MNKKQFLQTLDEAIDQNSGVMVYIDIPGNLHKEKITNHAEDVANKRKYYDETYDKNMVHKHSPTVSISKVKPIW